MCRLTAYLGRPTLAADLVTRPSRSVIRQSFDARERLGGSGGEVYDRGHLNADGFGLGWYTVPDPEAANPEDLMPCVFKEVGPAWHNRNLHRLCQKIRSPILLAHVRAAGPGMGVSQDACHPFEWGRYLFMHNGQVAGYTKIRRKLMDCLSQCAYDFCIANSASDSALSFALFIDQLEDPLAPISPQELQLKLVKVIRRITQALDEAGVVETSLLNFVITDGTALVATRFACNKMPECKSATLYYSSGSSFEPSSVASEPPDTNADDCTKVHLDGMAQVCEYRILHEDKRDDMVIVTSEPLTAVRADWCVCVCVCVSVCVLCICVCMYMHTYIYVCIYVYIYIYIYIYIFIGFLSRTIT